jgi:hypothetical protein
MDVRTSIFCLPYFLVPSTVECHIKCFRVFTEMAIFAYFWTSSIELLEQTQSIAFRSPRNKLYHSAVLWRSSCNLPLRGAILTFRYLGIKIFRHRNSRQKFEISRTKVLYYHRKRLYMALDGTYLISRYFEYITTLKTAIYV